MAKRLILLLFIFSFKLGTAQLLDSLALDTMKGYTSLDDAKLNPDKVIKLVLIKKKIADVPEDIRQFKNLQYLDLSRNKLKVLPAWIGELSNLQVLILSHNSIDTLPPEIGKLSNLQWFTMNRDNLDALPKEIGNLSKLRYLDMWGDNIGFFPTSLSRLTNLRFFDLRDILINQETQNTIKSYLPHCDIEMSPACPCKN